MPPLTSHFHTAGRDVGWHDRPPAKVDAVLGRGGHVASLAGHRPIRVLSLGAELAVGGVDGEHARVARGAVRQGRAVRQRHRALGFVVTGTRLDPLEHFLCLSTQR